MAIEVSPPEGELGPVWENTDVNVIITASGVDTEESESGEDGEEGGSKEYPIISTKIRADISNDHVVLTDGINTCSIVGRYQDIFTDSFIRFLDSSGQLVQVNSFDELPEDHGEIIHFHPDPRNELIVTYIVTVSTELMDHVFTYTMTVRHDYTPGKEALLRELGKSRSS